MDIDYALHCAARYGKLDIVYLLVERGADISSDDERALRHFVFYPIKFENNIEKYLSRKPNYIYLFKLLVEKKQILPLVTSSRREK